MALIKIIDLYLKDLRIDISILENDQFILTNTFLYPRPLDQLSSFHTGKRSAGLMFAGKKRGEETDREKERE